MRDIPASVKRIAELIAKTGSANWTAFVDDPVLRSNEFTGAEQIRSFWRRNGATLAQHPTRSEHTSDAVISPDTDLVSEIVRRVLAELKPTDTTQEQSTPEPTKQDVQMPQYGREVALFDLHHPYHDTRALASILAFLRDYKPDVLILGGDAMDAGPFSHWTERKINLIRTMPPAHEMFGSFIVDILKPIRDAIGADTYIIYLLGNHEDWVRQAIEADPRGEGFWEVERNMGGLVDSVVPYVSENQHNHVNMGKLYFTHGYTTNVYHARKVADDYNRPVRYGHTHDMQLYTHRTAVDVHDFHIARSCGCLCNLNPAYAKNRPNRWVHGFQYGEVERDGSFSDDVPVIINGRFKADGVWYGG